jgi:hypothetical protein
LTPPALASPSFFVFFVFFFCFVLVSQQSREYELLKVTLEQVLRFTVMVLEDATMFDSTVQAPDANQLTLFSRLLRDVCKNN